MEALGHYYTVYLTSLAVGFKPEIAYWQAVLAQMPDQVNFLDAATMHEGQCWDKKKYKDLLKQYHLPENERYVIDYGLHALPDIGSRHLNSSGQQKRTVQRLDVLDPRSLKFGLLLHRLGDTFAHTRADNPAQMYRVNKTACYPAGHLEDFNAPDYGFLKPKRFLKYLDKLYAALHHKISDRRYSNLRGTQTVLCRQHLKSFFSILLLDRPITSSGVIMPILDDIPVIDYARSYINKQIHFFDKGKTPWEKIRNSDIEVIRHFAKKRLNVEMEKYAPEKNDPELYENFYKRVNTVNKQYRPKGLTSKPATVIEKVRQVFRDFENWDMSPR